MIAVTSIVNAQVYKPGDGVTLPEVTKSVKPQYTKEAMAERIEGTVGLSIVVLASGRVGDVDVTRSSKISSDSTRINLGRRDQRWRARASAVSNTGSRSLCPRASSRSAIVRRT